MRIRRNGSVLQYEHNQHAAANYERRLRRRRYTIPVAAAALTIAWIFTSGESAKINPEKVHKETTYTDVDTIPKGDNSRGYVDAGFDVDPALTPAPTSSVTVETDNRGDLTGITINCTQHYQRTDHKQTEC